MPIVSKKIIPKKPSQIIRCFSLKEFSNKRNKILIVRGIGGLGDILMHRMMFEDFCLLMPDCEIHFACPTQYHDAVKDHPFVAKVLDSNHVDRGNYIVSYTTTKACGAYEGRKAPISDMNRSDIWAAHCGLKLTRHNMHISMTSDELKIANTYLEPYRDKPVVVLCPISSMASKNLNDTQIKDTVKGLYERGYNVVTLHDKALPYNIPCITHVNTRIWMAILHQADHVISVDTAAFHCRGGMQKSVLGVFAWSNGEIYGHHYNKKVIVQGPCPLGHRGCYTWNACPVDRKTLTKKPCIMELTAQSILLSFDQLVDKYSERD